MHVKDIMNQPVITCSSDSALNVAAQLMWEHDCGTIPVVDHEGRLAGMITDRDICMAAYTQGLPLQAIPVTSAMTRYALACHLDDSVNTAEELMREGQIRRVPVIDNDGRPVGIVAVSDITRFAARPRKPTWTAPSCPRWRPSARRGQPSRYERSTTGTTGTDRNETDAGQLFCLVTGVVGPELSSGPMRISGRHRLRGFRGGDVGLRPSPRARCRRLADRRARHCPGRGHSATRLRAGRSAEPSATASASLSASRASGSPIARSGLSYLFDATPDMVSQLGTLNGGRPPTAVFLTHGHIGHYTGLMYLGRESLDAKGVPVHGTERMAAYLSTSGPWSQLVTRKNIDLRVMEPGQAVALEGGVRVTAFTVPHRDEFTDTVGYLIEREDHRARVHPRHRSVVQMVPQHPRARGLGRSGVS